MFDQSLRDAYCLAAAVPVEHANSIYQNLNNDNIFIVSFWNPRF